MPKTLVFLKTDQEFDDFKKSRGLVSPNFRLRWRYTDNQNHPRFGFIVPKKVMKKVTDRNLVKRRVKSILSKHLGQLYPVDILFFPKPGSIKVSFKDLEAEVVENFKKAGIIKQKKD